MDANGDYGAVIVSVANLNIQARDVTAPNGTALVVLQNEIPQEVNLAVAQMAKAAGAQVWLNAAPARALAPELVDTIDLLIVNRVEAEFYADGGPISNVLTTLGADGVSYQGGNYPGHLVNVISSHGAGDMFVGVLAAQVARGTNMVDAIAFAQAAAAMHVASSLEERSAISRDKADLFSAAQDRR